MPIAEDMKPNPPTQFNCYKCGKTILSRCIIHPQSHGLCYKEHLDKEHRPGVEA